jgi:hypothetical protein
MLLITLPNFRLIDVYRKCVVPAPGKCHYLALSYVWGSVLEPNKLHIASNSIQSLGEEGILSTPALPATIADATEVCRQPNERFLGLIVQCCCTRE